RHHRAHGTRAMGRSHRVGGRVPVPCLGCGGICHRHRRDGGRWVSAHMTGEARGSRVVAITGAGGALGTAVARRLAGEATTALVVSDVSEQALAATTAVVEELSVPVASRVADVSDPEAVDAVAALAVER